MAEASDQERLLARFGRRFSAGEILFSAGDSADRAYLLQEGRVRLFKSIGGRERSLRVARPGDLFGEAALLETARRHATAVALDEGLALALDAATLQTVLVANPSVGTQVMQQIVRRLREAEDQLEILLLNGARAKVVAALIKLAEQRDQGLGEPLLLAVSPSDLSTMTGLEVDALRQTVNTLRDKGYISIEKHELKVHQLEALRELLSLLSIKNRIAGAPPADAVEAGGEP